MALLEGEKMIEIALNDADVAELKNMMRADLKKLLDIADRKIEEAGVDAAAGRCWVVARHLDRRWRRVSGARAASERPAGRGQQGVDVRRVQHRIYA